MTFIQKNQKALGHKYDDQYTWGHFHIRKSYIFSGAWLGAKLYCDPKNGGKLLFLHVPFIDMSIKLNEKYVEFFDDDVLEYGAYMYDRTDVCFEWGTFSKRFYLPWTPTWHSTEYLTQDLKSVVCKDTKQNRIEWETRDGIVKLISDTAPYTYVRKNGEKQERIATFYVSRRTWKWQNLPFIKRSSTTIWVSFSDEVGEKIGSWKGGVTGCGYVLKYGETPLQCLRRMEVERKFER